MPRFTIESTYRIPVYRQRTYEANSVEQACRLAVEDGDWSDHKEDYESSGEAYVSGAWPGENTAYRVAALPVPSQFGETLQRKADYFETLLGILRKSSRARRMARRPICRSGGSAPTRRPPRPRRSSPESATPTD